MRRFLSSILAILVVVLSCIPCDDEAAVSTVEDAAVVLKASTDAGSSDNHQMDLCSPFCTCSCCAGFAIPASFAVTFSNASAFAEQPVDSFSPEAAIEVHLPIWQPPKLG